jgi:hypothetical protein
MNAGRVKSDVQTVAKQFESTLKNVNRALLKAFGEEDAAFGASGFNEPTFVFLLAETMRANKWDVEYEQLYRAGHHSGGKGGSHRSDIYAAKGEAKLLIEAKWWWDEGKKLKTVLSTDEWKLRLVDQTQAVPLALVVTVADTQKELRDSLNACPPRWECWATAEVQSPYSVLKGDKIHKGPVRKALLGAGFYRPSERQ